MPSFIRRLGISALLSVAVFSLPAKSQELDRIVAIVDDGVVTKTQLDERLTAIQQRFASDPTQLPPEAILREQVLERLITEELQMQLARRSGIRISNTQVDQAFSELATANGMEPGVFLAQLSSLGEASVTKVVRDLQNELTIQQLQQIQVPKRIQITDAEVAHFLETAEGKMWSSPELLLQHIFVGLPSTAGPDQVAVAENTVKAIIDEFGKGADFGNLAVQYSSGADALDGGQIGWRRAIEFAPELGVALENVFPGDLVGPVRGAGGIHLFLVNDVRGGGAATMVQQTKTRHILIRPSEIRSSEAAHDLIKLIYEKLENGESFTELARTYSDDIANALNGGDLGWVLPGQMVAEFEKATNDTAAGEYSEPILTAFGWHILLVEDRRDVDMSDQIMQQQARNVIGSQRFEEELDLWIREIRGDAFIQVLDN